MDIEKVCERIIEILGKTELDINVTFSKNKNTPGTSFFDSRLSFGKKFKNSEYHLFYDITTVGNLKNTRKIMPEFLNLFEDFLLSHNIALSDDVVGILIMLHEIGHLDHFEKSASSGVALGQRLTNFLHLSQGTARAILSRSEFNRLRKDKNSIDPYYDLHVTELYANQYTYKNFYKVYKTLKAEGLIK